MRPLALIALSVLIAAPANAGIPPIVETDNVLFRVGGYTRAFTAGLIPVEQPAIGLQGTILRAEWQLSLYDTVRLDVHNRFSWLILSEGGGLLSGAGVGTSIPPARSVDLSSMIVDRPTHKLEHDLDRLSLRLFLGPVDLSLGRQAVTWGVANLFPVSDLWTTFSPFDLDTSQKRGIDAVRATTGIGSLVELDFIVADRGTVEDLSGGVRSTFFLKNADIYVAFAKTYEELALMAGISAEVSTLKLRAEAVGIFDLDDNELQLPRVTGGVDWFVNPDVMLSMEYHFNGVGAEKPEDYLSHAFQSEELARGETYLLGQHYLGGLISYKAHDLVMMALSYMTNLSEPSSLIIWNVNYSLAASVDLGVGGFHGVGPQTTEFGLRGDMVYLQLAAFF